jgi:hypothetical protein
MQAERKVTRSALLAAGIVAVGVAIVALREVGGRNPDAWATIAAVLAVIAAVISAWTTQRVTELQEDALEPNLQPAIDARSRYGLVQFRILNKGQTSAHDIAVKWSQPLHRVGGEAVSIGEAGKIRVLLAGESTSVLLGETSAFFAEFGNTTACGTFTFHNASGDAIIRDFVVSAEHERSALRHDREDPRTQDELQRIPEALKEIANRLKSLEETLRARRRNGSA